MDQRTTQDLLATAQRHMTPNYAPPPFVAHRGRGSILWDLDGREYLDFTSGIGVNALGHAHPEVQRAIAEQATRLCHTSNLFYHQGYIELCERLCQLSFGEQVYLCNSGTEAVEGAFKLARRYFYDRGERRRVEFVSTHESFHGRTMGAIAATGQPKYQEGFAPLMPGVRHVSYGDLDELTRAIGAETAAVILEPIQGNAGVNVPPPGYLRAVRDLCTRTGALLIFDEVQTGIGRTGRWFAHQHDDVTPDLLTVAKAIGGGLPLGALVTTRAIGAALQPGLHASTFGGNPVACAAGLAVLRVIEREGLLDNAKIMGDYFAGRLRELGPERVVEVRHRGLMVGITTKLDGKAAVARCRELGLLTNLGGTQGLRFLPPLNVSRAELDRAIDVAAKALAPE